MKHLVFLETQAGELEKILSGVKCLLAREIDPDEPADAPPEPGDTLYFLRDNAELVVRIQATVLKAWQAGPDEDIASLLKELQPRLQLTEGQYNAWSGKKAALFIEFEAAQKIEELHIDSEKISLRKRWVNFEEVRESGQERRDDASGHTS